MDKECSVRYVAAPSTTRHTASKFEFTSYNTHTHTLSARLTIIRTTCEKSEGEHNAPFIMPIILMFVQFFALHSSPVRGLPA